MKALPILIAGLALLVAACDADGGGSDDYTASLQQADAARQAGDFDSAIPLYGRALQDRPDGAAAKIGLGQSYLSAGLPAEAAAAFRDVLARRESDPAARRGLAMALVAMGQPSLAEHQLEAAVAADPRDYRTLNAYGVMLDMLGRHAAAQARYREGIQIAPNFIALRSNYGLSLTISGQAPEAIELLLPLVNSSAADGRIRQNLAFAYAMNGDFENCLKISRKDLDEASAQRQLQYFMQLRTLPVEQRSAELRRNPNFFPQTAAGG
jgi:Flp pilus assembly protein TadD